MREIFQYGVDLLARAGNDQDLLGMSLIHLHGGLETYFRSQLEEEIALFEAREQKPSTWPDLINLWGEQRDLSDSERTTLLAYNKLRNNVAHAKMPKISRESVEKYANFVQKISGIHLPTRQSWRHHRLAWLIPIFALFLVIIGFILAINFFGLNEPLPPLPPTITPISPAALVPPTNMAPHAFVAASAYALSSPIAIPAMLLCADQVYNQRESTQGCGWHYAVPLTAPVGMLES